MNNLGRIEMAIDCIEQLGADMKYKVNCSNLDLDVEIASIENWLNDLKRRLKAEKEQKINENKQQKN